MADLKLDGLGVALVTPFKKDLSIDFDALGNLIDHVINGGCDYIVALGTTAETPTLSQNEKDGLTRFIYEKNSGRVPLVLGIGGNNTVGVIEDINSRNLTGYSAILSVTPYYNKPNQEGLFLHFKEICDNSPLPIILYNVPGRTGVNLTAHTTLRLANYSEKICAIKEASGKFDQCEEIIQNSPSNFKLISGDDGAIFNLMKRGANGVISVLANAFPKESKKLVTLCLKKEFEEAEEYQEKLMPLINHLFADGNPGGIKAGLSYLNLINNLLRLPLVTVSQEIEDKIRQACDMLGDTE